MYGPPDPFFIDDPEIRHATFRAFNDWVLEFEKAAPERLIAVAQLDYLDPEFSAEEFERTAALGIRHVNVLAATAEPSWYEPEWERFWSIADETDIPVGSHLTVVVQRERKNPSKPNYGGAVFSLGQQLVEPYAGLILNGVLDRHPGVKTVMAESQISWVPNMIQTMDSGWRRGRIGTVPGFNAACKLKPSEYFANNIWMTFQDDPFGVQMLPMLFEDRVMWASDYPHPASTWPDSQETINRQLDGVVNDETRKKLLFANAQLLYGL
jgi:predicted TIM-barrel fold metal-dependent hydrolase